MDGAAPLPEHAEGQTLDEPIPSSLTRSFPPQGADAFLAVSQGRLEQQMTTLDALDTKAHAMFAGAVAEVGFLLAMLAIRPENRPLSWWSWLGIFLTLAAAAWVLWRAWSAQRVREWEAYPSSDRSWKLGYSHMPLAWEMGLSLAQAHASNEAGRKAKTDMVKQAGVGVLALTGVVVLASISIAAT